MCNVRWCNGGQRRNVGKEGGDSSDSGERLANAPRDGLLNLFFALQYSLAKVLNALRLNDAPWQGDGLAKNRFFTQSVKDPLMTSRSSPPCSRPIVAAYHKNSRISAGFFAFVSK